MRAVVYEISSEVRMPIRALKAHFVEIPLQSSQNTRRSGPFEAKRDCRQVFFHLPLGSFARGASEDRVVKCTATRHYRTRTTAHGSSGQRPFGGHARCVARPALAMALQAVRECGLLAYLSATTQPAVVLDSVPLHEAVAARQAPLETPRWHTALAKLDVSSTFSPSEVRLEDQHQADPDYFNVKELPATTHPSSLGLGAASRIVWSNSAYAAFVQDTARRDEADGKSEGIHRGREWSVDSDMDGDDDDDDDEPTSAPLTSPVPSTKDFHFLSSDDQEDLLKFLLDLLEQSAESPATTPGSSFAAQPAATTVELSKSAFTATVLPRFVVLSVLPRSRQSPAPRGTAARTLAALYTGYGEPAVIKNSLWPSDSLPRRPSLGFGSLDSASGTSLSPVRPLDLYMQMLSATEIGRLIRDYDWATTELGPISAWKPELKTMVSCILSSPFKECILLGDNRRIIYNEA